jgi:hypothetical protein
MRSDVSHFKCEIDGGIARISLDRPDRKNPLTFDSYAEMRDWFRDLHYADDVHAVVILPNGGNFSSGGDVHDIIGPLTRMNMKELLAFTRMTGDLVKAMIGCGKPIVSAVDGICAGAGRDPGHGIGPAGRDPGGEGRLPVQPGRPCRLRHGRLRDPAPDHWSGPCVGTALSRPLHERG